MAGWWSVQRSKFQVQNGVLLGVMAVGMFPPTTKILFISSLLRHFHCKRLRPCLLVDANFHAILEFKWPEYLHPTLAAEPSWTRPAVQRPLATLSSSLRKSSRMDASNFIGTTYGSYHVWGELIYDQMNRGGRGLTFLNSSMIPGADIASSPRALW